MDEQEIKKEGEVVEPTQCEKEREEYLQGWKRAKADLINFKKEEAERLASVLKRGNENIVRDVATVLDSFELGIQATGGETAAAKGMQLIKNQLEDILKRHGLEVVHAKKGEMFDPSKHEAMQEVESDEPEGTVAEELDRGYALHGKVFRAARVTIAKVKKEQK